jgi:ProP effector
MTHRSILRLRYPPSTVTPKPVPAISRRERVAAYLAELRTRFPRAFSSEDAPAPWRPLKSGIHRDIAARAPELAVSKSILREAVGLYVSRAAYRAGLVEGAVRIDLDGADAGLVTREQLAAALRRNANQAKDFNPRPEAAREVGVVK